MIRKNLHNSLLGIGIEYRNYLRAFSPEFSGDLKKSLQFNVYDDDSGLDITGAYYFKFMDKGVSGKNNVIAGAVGSYTTEKPPLLTEWSKAKGLNPYAVRESIFQKGLEPRNMLDKSTAKMKNIGGRIAEGYIKDIRDELKNKYK